MAFEEQIWRINITSAIIESSDDIVNARRIDVRAIARYANRADLIVVIDGTYGLLAANILANNKIMLKRIFIPSAACDCSVTHRITVQSSEPLATR